MFECHKLKTAVRNFYAHEIPARNRCFNTDLSRRSRKGKRHITGKRGNLGHFSTQRQFDCVLCYCRAGIDLYHICLHAKTIERFFDDISIFPYVPAVRFLTRPIREHRHIRIFPHFHFLICLKCRRNGNPAAHFFFFWCSTTFGRHRRRCHRCFE